MGHFLRLKLRLFLAQRDFSRLRRFLTIVVTLFKNQDIDHTFHDRGNSLRLRWSFLNFSEITFKKSTSHSFKKLKTPHFIKKPPHPLPKSSNPQLPLTLTLPLKITLTNSINIQTYIYSPLLKGYIVIKRVWGVYIYFIEFCRG